MMIQEEKQLSINEHLLACKIMSQVDSAEELELKFAVANIDFEVFKRSFKSYVDFKILPKYHRLISDDGALKTLVGFSTHFVIAYAMHETSGRSPDSDFQVIAYKNGKQGILSASYESYELYKNALGIDVESAIMTLIKYECY